MADRTPAVAGPGTAEAPAAGATGHDGAVFAVLIAGYPLAWALGLAPIWYTIVAVPMALWLLRHRPLAVPPGTLLFALFLVVVAASAIQLNSVGRLAIYLLRTSWYAAALVAFVYLARHRGLPGRATVVRAIVALWALAIAGGYLAILAPELEWSTPTAALLPGALADNEFIHQLITPQAAEIQVFRFEDVTLFRPAAPFAYTNAWGSTVALTTPFAIAAVQDRGVGIPRVVLVPLLIAGAVPFYTSLNRGAWLTLGLGVCYGIVRHAAIRRNPVPILALVAVAGVAATVALWSGVLGTAAQQLETRAADSNETRASLYVETLEETARSPLIGYGSTRPNPANPSGPPLGTHGQLWAVLFAHGYLGAGLYLAFFGTAFLRARPLDPVPHWAKVSLFIGLLQLPIYGHLPNQLFVMVGAAAIAGWGRQRVRSRVA